MSTVYIRFVAHGAPPLQRSPLVERMLARAGGRAPVADWRADAFSFVAPPGTAMPPIASVPPSSGPPAVWRCVATPVHLSAGLAHVNFPDDGILRLEPGEAAALTADFNRVFKDSGVLLSPGPAGQLRCGFDRILDVVTRDPESAIGQDIFRFQPSGPDAQRLRRLTSEIDMWLFDHEVNRQRQGRQRLPVTGLWLWGGGAPVTCAPTLDCWAAGPDVFFEAYAGRPRGSGSGVVVVHDHPGSSTWPQVEQQWLQPLLMDLTRGRIAQIHLSAAHLRFTLSAASYRRFWRRSRPWWETMSEQHGSD